MSDAQSNGAQSSEALSQPGALELLETATLCRLAYVAMDGSPRVIPTGFLWTDASVVICTSPTSPKYRALGAHPQVALTIESPSGMASLQLRGRAAMTVVAGVPDEYLAASLKSFTDGAAAREAFIAGARRMYPEMARIEIRPDWARFYDFSAGRLPGFLDELAARANAAPE